MIAYKDGQHFDSGAEPRRGSLAADSGTDRVIARGRSVQTWTVGDSFLMRLMKSSVPVIEKELMD